MNMVSRTPPPLYRPSSSPVNLDWPDISPIKPDEDSNEKIGNNPDVVTSLSNRSDAGVHSPVPSKRKASPIRTSSKASLREPQNYDVAALLQQSWRKAIRVLRANPSLMTRAILCLALRQRPPAYVVDWMLRLNPDAATAPSADGGPSPLFIAVKERCSTAVVETILRANPKALEARSPDSQWDPVVLAKRERGNESDLLSLLRRPVSHWSKEERQGTETRFGVQKRNITIIPEADIAAPEELKEKLNMPHDSTPVLGIQKREQPLDSVLPSIVTPEDKPRHHIPSLLHRTRPLGTSTTPDRQLPQPLPQSSTNLRSAWTPAERQELDNVKFLCLALLKAHRRLIDSQQDLNGNKTVIRLEESERQALFQDMEKRQQEQARVCLIALDMKEKAIHALARRLEERLTSSPDTQVSQQLRSSYVHLYKRFLGLEQELHVLKQRATLASPSLSSSSCMDIDSSQAVFDPPPEQYQAVVKSERHHDDGDDEQSLRSEQDSHGERSRSCLRPPAWLLRPRFTP